jgi:hypothetical protein
MSKSRVPWASYVWKLGNIPGPFPASEGGGMPFSAGLLTALGADARIIFEVAWGAGAGTDPATWSWADISADVYAEPGINFRYGRSDEATTPQPATASLMLDNVGGKYSLGPQSPNWPNVKRGVPFRVRINLSGTGFVTAFQGNITGFKPGWSDASGKIPAVSVEVAGSLRRLLSTKDTVISTARRAYADDIFVVAYWPCEDGKDSTYLSSALSDRPAMYFTVGAPQLASNTDFAGSQPLPVVNSSAWTGDISPYVFTGAFQSRFLAEFTAGSEPANNTVIHRLWATGSVARWEVLYNTGGLLTVVAYDAAGVALSTTPALVFHLLDAPRQRRISLEIAEGGGTVFYRVGVVQVAPVLGNVFVGQLTSAFAIVGATQGTFYRVEMNPGAVTGSMVFGHIICESIQTDMFDDASKIAGYPGESATARFRRLCVENGLLYTQYPNPPSAIEATTAMGPQRPGTLIDLLRECEMADQAVMFDGLSNGLTFVASDFRDNQTALFAIDASAFELSPPFEPVHDDQRSVNSAKVNRSAGVEATYEDVDGPFGTKATGTHSASETINLYADSQAVQFAAWLVHLGTYPGYRYPTITIDLLANPRFARYVVGLLPGSRIDITGIGSVLPDQAVDTVSLVVEGVSQRVTPDQWTVSLQCSPFDLWRIIVLAADVGDTSEFLCHLDTDDSRTVDTAYAGDTAVTVQTMSGPIWTQDPDDFPFYISIGGVRATVTNITGSASPQTFTIQPLSTSRPGGSQVEVWNPPVLRIGDI